VGSRTGASITTGAGNSAFGFAALCSVTTGNNTAAFGSSTLTALTSGGGNSAFGTNAAVNLTTGSTNVVIGSFSASSLVSGDNNVVVGNAALNTAVSSSNNVAVGVCALRFATSGNNVALGFQAGAATTTGSDNTYLGEGAGRSVTTGGCNTLIGAYAGVPALSNNVVLSDGAGNIKLQVNENGALGVGTTPTYGAAGQVLKSAGTAAAPAWSSALYGAFSSSATQTNADTTNGNAVTLNTTASANGFSIVSGSQITATTAGVYNIQISLQVEKSGGGTSSAEVWFKKNGADIANSNTNIELQGNGAKQLFALNLVEPLTAVQYLEVWWY
jgi:hypothetical protein